jgi:hypothetical protein
MNLTRNTANTMLLNNDDVVEALLHGLRGRKTPRSSPVNKSKDQHGISFGLPSSPPRGPWVNAQVTWPASNTISYNLPRDHHSYGAGVNIRRRWCSVRKGEEERLAETSLSTLETIRMRLY